MNDKAVCNNIIVPIFIILLFCSSCKYEDGPGISLRRACNRVEGNYTIDKFEVNNHDSLIVFISRNCNGKIDFLEDDKINGNLLTDSCRYSGRSGEILLTSKWELNHGKKELLTRGT